MSQIKLTLPSPLIKGCVVEASSSANIEMLASDFAVCWDTVYSLSTSLAPNEVISITIEIWPDTGRIFWITKARRELFRLEIKVPAIEAAYFDFLNSPNSESQYEELIHDLRGLLRKSFVPPYIKVSTIVLRDSDDSETEEVLFST